MTLTTTLVFGLFLVAPPQDDKSSAAKVPIRDLVVLTADESLAASLRKTYKFEMNLNDLKVLLPSSRFVVQTEESWMVAIDTEAPFLAKASERAELLNMLATHVGPDGVVRANELTGKDRASFSSALDQYFPPHTRANGFDAQSAAVGLEITTNATLFDQKSNSYRNIALPMSSELTRMRDKALASNPMPQRTTALSKQEQEKIQSEGIERTSQLERATFHTYGTARSKMPIMLKRATEVLEKRLSEIDIEASKSAEKLIGKLGATARLEDLPKGKVPLHDLPQAMQNQITDQLRGSWKGLGYGSWEDANAALRSGQIEMSFSIGLRRTFRGYDPATGAPGSGMVYNIALIRP